MSQNYVSRTSMVIPLRGLADDEIIEIDFSDLPEGDEVLQILKQEKAALHYWLDLAVEYYKAKKMDDFIKILEQSGEEASLEYPDADKDQMRALDMLAAYYVHQGSRERNKEKRKERFAKATILYTTADKLIMYDTTHVLGRAYFCLLEGNKVDQADAQFSFILKPSKEQGAPPNVAALLGKACIAYKKRDYKMALSFFKKCLRFNPRCPADVRVGLGYCLAHLGYYEKARFAFERVLELDPSNISAIVALAVLDINTGEPQHIAHGIQGLGTAYESEPENPMVLNHLANHFFYKNDLDKTETLAWHAFHCTENDQMKAESCYQIARCFHKRGDHDRAFQFYYQATQFVHPKFPLPHFGLGQIYIGREEYENAVTAFERVLKIAPNNYETLSILGSLYAYLEQKRESESTEQTGSSTSQHHQQSKSSHKHGQGKDAEKPVELREKARDMLKKVVEMNGEDIETQIELAQLQEQVDPQGALDLYLRVVELLRSIAGVEAPAEILNNIGSLYFMRRQPEKARDYFEAAKKAVLQVGGTDVDANETAAMLITITFNLGRACEALCQFDEAERIYTELRRRRPTYLDCILRLGCLHRDKGDVYKAAMYFKEAISLDANNPDPWTHLGNMHMTNNELGPAQKKYEQILKKKGHENDAYCLVGMGNIWLQALYNSVSKERDAVNRQRAEDMYRRALRYRPKNIWAANGLGCVLALKGQIEDARDVFSQVREVTADLSDVWINIAHIYMEKRQYVQALQMYHNCQSTFRLYNDVSLLMYIARAYWRAEKRAEARDYVERAIAEAPTDLLIRFNHAAVLERTALAVLQAEKVTCKEVEAAVRDLKTAECTYEFISKTSDEEIRKYQNVSRTLCRQEQRTCSDLLAQAHIHFQRAKVYDEEERRTRERLEKERLELLRVKEESERMEQERVKREKEVLALSRQKFVELKKEALLMKPTEVVEKKAGSQRVSAKQRRAAAVEEDDFLNDSSDLGEYFEKERNREPVPKEGAGAEKRRSRRSKREREYDEEHEGESSEGEERGGQRGRGREAVHYRTKTAEELEMEEVPQRLRKKVKSKAFVSSSEESSADEGAASPAASSSQQQASDDGGGGESAGPQSGEDEPEPGMSSASTATKRRRIVDSDEEGNED